MKKLIWLIVFAAVAYFTKPEKTALYEQALRQEFNLGTSFFPNVKLKMMEGKYSHHNYLVCNVLRDKKENKAYYLGIFTKVFQLQEPPPDLDVDIQLEK